MQRQFVGNVPGAFTQAHITFDDTTRINKFDVDQIEDERRKSHASDMPTGFPDVYVNGEDVTVTIDPVGNSYWIRDDLMGHRHAKSVARGALKDHKGVIKVQHLIDSVNLKTTVDNFIPTSEHLDKADKFTPRCVANSTRGFVGAEKLTGMRKAMSDPRVGRGKRAGKLPAISAMIWNGQLSDKPDWLTELEMWDSRDVDARFFDCGGRCR